MQKSIGLVLHREITKFDKMNMRLKNFHSKFFTNNQLGQSNQSKFIELPTALFLLTIIFYFTYMLLMQPRWILGGEMWAEMATNYFINANSNVFLQQFFSTDAGYIPFPQRLIAYLAYKFRLPAATIPYFYTWSALLITGILAGTFCLKPFRKIVKSDGLRFFAGIAVLMVADFETKTFVSFTYFGAFYISIITALALIDNSEDVPWWSWIIPILMLSKPSVIAALPAMAIVSLFAGHRFRLIFIVSALICMAQIMQMHFSAQSGIMPFLSGQFDLLATLTLIIKYFLGFMGLYITGPIFQLSKITLIYIGAVYIFLCVIIIFFKKAQSNSLILVGTALVFFNAVINIFAIPDMWGANMGIIDYAPTYRHAIVGFFGNILVVTGLIAHLQFRVKSFFGIQVNNFYSTIFLLWFIGSGWFLYAGNANKEPIFPMLNNSQWQKMADAIDLNLHPICVPINPWLGVSWIYQRNCKLLNAPPAWRHGSTKLINPFFYKIAPLKDLSSNTLISAAIFIKPLSTSKEFIEAKMLIKLNSGMEIIFSGQQETLVSGNLLLLTGNQVVPVRDISSIELVFNLPVEIASSPKENAAYAGVAWMGY
jgi:hypothetical protein